MVLQMLLHLLPQQFSQILYTRRLVRQLVVCMSRGMRRAELLLYTTGLSAVYHRSSMQAHLRLHWPCALRQVVTLHVLSLSCTSGLAYVCPPCMVNLCCPCIGELAAQTADLCPSSASQALLALPSTLWNGFLATCDCPKPNADAVQCKHTKECGPHAAVP